MRVIPEKDKRIAINEFLHLYDGLPARSMLTGEYLWPLRPELTPAYRSQRTIHVSERPDESDEEESIQERPQEQRKRSAPWCATDQAIVKKRSEMQRLARRTALREAGEVVERSASCDSKQADFIRLYLSELDEECTKATGMQFALVTHGTYSWSIPHMIFVIICRHEGYRKAM